MTLPHVVLILAMGARGSSAQARPVPVPPSPAPRLTTGPVPGDDRLVRLGTTSDPKVFLDTSSVEKLAGSRFRMRFRVDGTIRVDGTLRLAAGAPLSPRMLRAVRTEQLDCASRRVSTLSWTVYDFGHNVIARSDSAESSVWRQPVNGSLEDVELSLFCTSRWRRRS